MTEEYREVLRRSAPGARRRPAPICSPSAHELTDHRNGGDPSSVAVRFNGPAILVGGFSVRDTPVPIPNTVVKPHSADGTAGAARWESTSSPTPCENPRSLKAPGGFRVQAWPRSEAPARPHRDGDPTPLTLWGRSSRMQE